MKSTDSNNGKSDAPLQSAFGVVARNSLWSLAGYLIPIVISILSIPIFTYYLGVELFGLWMVVISIFSMANIFNVGLGDATIKYVSEYYSKGEHENASRVVYSTLLFYSLVAIVVSFLLWIFREQVSHFLASKADCDSPVVAKVLGVVCMGIFPSITITAILGVFDGQQRFGVSRKLMMLRSFLIFGLGAVVLFSGRGIVSLTYVSVSVLWFVWIVGLLMVIASLKPVSIKNLRLFTSLKTVWGYGIHSVFINIGDIMTSQLDKLLIANLLGFRAVAIYSIPQFAGSKITELCGTISRSLMPYFSSLTAVGANPENAFFRAWRLSILVTLGFVTITLVNAQNILEVWAPAIYNSKTTILLVLFSVLAFINAVHVVPYMFLMGKGEPKIVARIVFSSGMAVSICIILFAPRWKIWGVAGAASIYPITTLLICKYAVKSLRNRNEIISSIKDFLLPAANHLVIGLLCWTINSIIKQCTDSGMAGLLVSVVLYVILLAAKYRLFIGKQNFYYGDIKYLLGRIGYNI